MARGLFGGGSRVAVAKTIFDWALPGNNCYHVPVTNNGERELLNNLRVA
jgi:hypothetical protein